MQLPELMPNASARVDLGAGATPEASREQAVRASAIAVIAHRGQVDKLGEPYIEHPRRVAALAAATVLDDATDAVAVAWLHDVIEDCDIAAEDLLAAGMRPELVDAVVLLTRTADTPDDIYYQRIKSNPLALAVKDADIRDNTAGWRTARLSEADRDRLAAKYAKARQTLGLE